MTQNLKDEKVKKKDLQIFWSSHTDLLVELRLYMRHDCYKCQLTDSLLSYYQVSYEKVENFLLLDQAKKADVIKKDYDVSDLPFKLVSGR